MSKTTSSLLACRLPEPAAYKIAARWSDGHLAELKTYGFACSEHLGAVFRESRAAPAGLHARRRANRSKSWRSIATSRENATAFCNDCGDWKRITGRDGLGPRESRPTRSQCGRDSGIAARGYVAPPLRTERLAQPSRGVLRLDFRRPATEPAAMPRDDIKVGQAAPSIERSARRSEGGSVRVRRSRIDRAAEWPGDDSNRGSPCRLRTRGERPRMGRVSSIVNEWAQRRTPKSCREMHWSTQALPARRSRR